MTDTKTACVKWFNPKSGYGFITDIETNDDIFVHHSELQASENVYRSLTTGEYVEYQLKVDDTGKSTAIHVTGIGGGLLLCETSAINMAERRERNSSRGTQRKKFFTRNAEKEILHEERRERNSSRGTRRNTRPQKE